MAYGIGRRLIISIAALAVFGWAATSAGIKFHALAVGAYPRGSRVAITMREFNAYLAAEIPEFVGPGVRNAHVETQGGDIVVGTANIDFLKVRQAQGERPGWLMSQLLAGERPVSITVRLTSGQRMARVDVLRVSVGDAVIEGRTLDFLITNFVLPTFPDVKVGKEFPMDYGIERLDLRPGQVVVVLRR